MKRYSPSEIETLTEWHAQGLRDMRNKGYLEGYGHFGLNGRWTYDLHDLVGLGLASILQDNMRIEGYVSLSQALGICKTHSSEAISYIKWGVEPGYSAWLTKAGKPGQLGGGELVSIKSLSELDTKKWHLLRVFNWVELVQSLPEKIKQEVARD